MLNQEFAGAELAVVEQNGELVVDSRLIADRLGIDHKPMLRMVEKYLTEFQGFGALRFENAAITGPVSGKTYQQRFCWLNENQATFLMSLSRNTAQVIECKVQLVAAFSAAKKLIKTVIPAQSEKIRELELTVRAMELEHQTLRLKDTLIALYGTELGLTLMGHSGQVMEVEKLVTEVVNPQTNNTDRILTAPQLKRVVKQKTGQNLKTNTQFVEALAKAGRDDLLIPVTRSATGLYVDADRIDEALSVVYGGTKQRLITPVADRSHSQLRQ
jgi:phage regulator Rha-like protein